MRQADEEEFKRSQKVIAMEIKGYKSCITCGELYWPDKGDCGMCDNCVGSQMDNDD